MIQNKWKYLFFTLFIINLLTLVGLFIFLKIPAKQIDIISDQSESINDHSILTVESNKADLNNLINAYLTENLTDTDYQYAVYLDDVVHLKGEIPVFSTNIPLYIQLDPFVQKNGDVILKQKSINLGLLELPNEKVLQYMKKYLKLPKWVTIDAKNEEIYIAISKIKFKSEFAVQVRTLDLPDDDISLDFSIPNDIFKKTKK